MILKNKKEIQDNFSNQEIDLILSLLDEIKDINDTTETKKSSVEITSILPIIPNPHFSKNEEENIDPISLIYSRFLEKTDIPILLPVFTFLSYLSAFTVNNNIMFKHPTSSADYLNTWTLILSPSSAAKTTSAKIIEKSIPQQLDSSPLISPNFEGADGSAAFVVELAKAQKHIDLYGKTIQPIFWIEDEYAQFMKKIGDKGSMTETRKTMLKAYDKDKVSRITKADTIETESIVMSGLFINTIDSFVRNFSKESISDGLGRRHNFLVAERSDRKIPTWELEEIESLLKENFDKFFSNIKTNVLYTFDPACREIYDRYFLIYEKKYEELLGQEMCGVFFRTYFMLSWKYSVLFHIITNQPGLEIKANMFDFGIKTSLMFLDSIKKFLDYKVDVQSGANLKRKEYLDKRANEELSNLKKYKEFLENNVNISLRDFSRKYNIKKADSLKIIKTVQKNNMLKYHPLFDTVINEEKKQKIAKEKKEQAKRTVIFDDDIPFD